MLLGITTRISIILAYGFALLQFCLTLGAPFGEYVLGGAHKILPNKMRMVSCAFSVVFAVIGTMFLQKSGAVNRIFHPAFVNGLLSAYTLFLAYAIIGNGFLSKSKKEKYLMTPLSAIGFLSSLNVLICNW